MASKARIGQDICLSASPANGEGPPEEEFVASVSTGGVDVKHPLAG